MKGAHRSDSAKSRDAIGVMNSRINKQMNKQMVGQTDGQKDRRRNAARWTDQETDGGMDKVSVKSIIKEINNCIFTYSWLDCFDGGYHRDTGIFSAVILLPFVFEGHGDLIFDVRLMDESQNSGRDLSSGNDNEEKEVQT